MKDEEGEKSGTRGQLCRSRREKEVAKGLRKNRRTKRGGKKEKKERAAKRAR